MDALTISTIIYGALALLLSAISIIITIITIRQNSRMLEASTRPYISIYFDYSNLGEPIGYFIVKNFGQSSGQIISLSYNDVVTQQSTKYCNVTAVFDGLVNNSIAPNQKFFVPIPLQNSPDGICTFDVSYRSSKKTYTEHFEIVVKQLGKLSKSRIVNHQYKEYKLISYPLQEIAERLM